MKTILYWKVVFSFISIRYSYLNVNIKRNLCAVHIENKNLSRIQVQVPILFFSLDLLNTACSFDEYDLLR
jgi:hypothetical protein